jgi:mannose-6-phosphate isomerase-like protein (cupin superfamily)
MATTYIDTNQCARIKLAGQQGSVAEIVNRTLCGAENVVGILRWLVEREHFETEILGDRHQLIYLMEGEGVITLDKKSYPVSKGGGIYIGPSETATISHAGAATLKLLHLVVKNN